MITIEELAEATGYDSFLAFTKKVTHSDPAAGHPEWTTYYFQTDSGTKEVDLDMTSEQLDQAADAEHRRLMEQGNQEIWEIGGEG
jgi:hypothetical protein